MSWTRVVWERIYPNGSSGPRYIVRGGFDASRQVDDRVHYPLVGECICGESHAPVKDCSAGTSQRELVGVGRRIREALNVDGDGVPTALVWIRPDVADKLILAGLAVHVTPPPSTKP